MHSCRQTMSALGTPDIWANKITSNDDRRSLSTLLSH